jgi:hypothetical protein
MAKAWKEFELWFAKQIGGERAGAVGREGPDVLHDELAPECKERKRPLQTLKKYMAQADANSPPGRVPLVVLHTLGDSHNKDLVVMHMEDWLKLWREHDGPTPDDSG